MHSAFTSSFFEDLVVHAFRSFTLPVKLLVMRTSLYTSIVVMPVMDVVVAIWSLYSSRHFIISRKDKNRIFFSNRNLYGDSFFVMGMNAAIQ